jgi:uroporphyrinogen decarboxylase
LIEGLADLDVPVIHFGVGTGHLLDAMRDAGGDAIGVDHRIPLDEAWRTIGVDRAIQGNLDPAALLGPWEVVERKARDVLARAGGRPGHVFNLGHGVLPETRVEHLERLVGLVHEETERSVP